MNYIQKRVADRKLTCARCQAVGRAFMYLKEWREIVARIMLPDASDHDKSCRERYQEMLEVAEAELVGETEPESWEIKRGEECMYVAMSGAHYLHLACTHKYLEDVRRAMRASK